MTLFTFYLVVTWLAKALPQDLCHPHRCAINRRFWQIVTNQFAKIGDILANEQGNLTVAPPSIIFFKDSSR